MSVDLADPETDAFVRSKSGVVHQCRNPKLVTRCGVPYVDLFATYEAGAFTMQLCEGPATCKSCLRANSPWALRGQESDDR